MLERDCLHQLRVDAQFSTKKVVWMERSSLDMKPPGSWDDPANLHLSLHVDAGAEAVDDASDERCATKIKHAKHKKVSAMKVAASQRRTTSVAGQSFEQVQEVV